MPKHTAKKRAAKQGSMLCLEPRSQATEHTGASKLDQTAKAHAELIDKMRKV